MGYFRVIVIVLSLLSSSYCIQKKKDDFVVNPKSIKGNVNSYAGFVNGIDDAQMFFWFFPSEVKVSDPVVLWVEGDIGSSSVKGLFENNGPFSVKPSRGLKKRGSYWSANVNMIYMDYAVGTGFSHTTRTMPVYSNIDMFVNNLFTSLKSFFRVFDEYKHNNFYIAGEGFACKIMAKLGEKIIADKSMKLKGLLIENGFCNPSSVIGVAEHYFNLGIIGENDMRQLLITENDILDLIRNKKFNLAFDKYDSYVPGILTPHKTLINKVTHLESTRNLIHDNDTREYGSYADFMNHVNIRHVLNVKESNQTFNEDKSLFKNVRGEIMENSLAELGRLLKHIDILMYFGQWNGRISPKAAFKTGLSIKWCAGEYFRDVDYKPWHVNNKLVGNTVNVNIADCEHGLSWALIRNAGLDVAGEQQEAILTLINKFFSGKFQ